jgi:hypothetical protein
MLEEKKTDGPDFGHDRPCIAVMVQELQSDAA